jgi:hypothetical protein
MYGLQALTNWFRTTEYQKHVDFIPKQIYESINWNVTLIGGSYALWMYTRDKNWQPNDIDIMIKCESEKGFNKECTRLIDKSCMTCVKQISQQDIVNKKVDANSENFHKYIVATKTLVHKDCYKSIQLIGVLTQDKTLEATFNEISDIPSCVTYRVDNGKKIFNVPEKGINILANKIGNANEICPARKRKYEERGYKFE